MKDVIRTLLIAFMFISISTIYTAMAQDSSGATESFATEGANVYDNIRQNIEESTQRGYEKLFGETPNSDYVIGGDMVKRIWVTLFYLQDVVASIYRFAFYLSWALGILLIILCRRNKKVQKFAWIALIFVFPIVLTFLRYGVPYLYASVVN